MRNAMIVLFLCFLIMDCKNSNDLSLSVTSNGVTCIESHCQGAYIGPEFIDGADIAHQFSNTMSHAVGDQLKLLYDHKKYSKVDFDKIEISTEGMGSGNVNYKLVIPFKKVTEKCDAYTSFDHVGGWNHKPELERRKKELSNLLLSGESLSISHLVKTKEGLEEYWIQWKNKKKQSDCSEN